MSDVDFRGQVAIVTGAGRGLGRAYALELARRGASVVVSDLRGSADYGEASGDSAADTVVKEIVAKGGKAVACCETVATPEGGQAIVDAALNAFGGIDVIIHNAGLRRYKYYQEMSADEIRMIGDVHLGGGFWVTKPAWPHMMKKGYGRILMTSSNAGAFGMKGAANYAAPKMGLLGLTRILSLEGEAHGIRVNAILPGAITHDTTKAAPKGRSAVKEEKSSVDILLETGRYAPDHVTPLALFLVSKDCNATGELFSAIDGRYARAVIGVASGWYAPETRMPTVEDVRDHFAEIREIKDVWYPQNLLEELMKVAAQRENPPKG